MRRLIQTYADTKAEAQPEAKAVVLGSEGLSYSQLFRWSNSLARALRIHGCMRGDRVGLLMSKSPLAIASILGILKADCAYVPIDVESPAARAATILGNAEPRLLLTDARGANTLAGLRSHSETLRELPAAFLDRSGGVSGPANFSFSGEDVGSFSEAALDYENRPDDPAYIFYTSGSTGIPKGVAITHANVACFIDWATAFFNLSPRDRLSGHPPLHFDLSVFDIFGAFAAGAELHLTAPSLNLSAPAMAEFIRASGLTQWFSVPSVLSYMAKFDVVRHGDFPGLKRVLWCGDVFPAPALRYWMERLPAVQFTNLYGPTETTIASSYYTVPSIPQHNEKIPIGSPCDGETLLVLDEHLQPVAKDVTGELYIGGAGLSPGYWKDPEKTRAAFLTGPKNTGRIYKTGDLARVGNDGLVYFAGRADTQVKCRGYRIELGEIEAALHTIAGLKESAIVAVPSDGFEGSLICCAFAPFERDTPTPLALREALRTRLPHYMLPGRWLALTRLPKNANGKIDRPLLKELFSRNAGTYSGV